MDCRTAMKVWNHSEGLIGGLNQEMPGLVEYLSNLVLAFMQRIPDPFDDAVKKIAGNGPYRVTHSDGESQLSRWVHDVLGDQVAQRVLENYLGTMHGIPNLSMANICCSGCKVSSGPLDHDVDYKIQLAAVNTDPSSL